MISIKSQIEEELQKELSNYPASCGVAVESVYNAYDRIVKITGKLTSNVTNTYRCLIYLVEDGIKYFKRMARMIIRIIMWCVQWCPHR